MTMNPEEVIPGLLLWVVFPLWLAAGLADYLCHRRTRIEETSGTPESRLHIVQFVQILVPTLMGLYLQINLLVILCMAVAWLLHTGTALWDTAYAAPRRYISPVEQHVHSYLEMLPLFTLLLLVILYWNELRPAELRFQLREPALPAAYRISVIGLMGLSLVPILEECWRGARRQNELVREL